MAEWQDIERAAQEHRRDLDQLQNVCGETERQVANVLQRRRHLIEDAAAKAAASEERLTELVRGSKHLFKSPKTQVVNGIKVGFSKVGGGFEVADEQAAITKAKEILSPDQQAHVIKVSEQLLKGGLDKLNDNQLGELGVSKKNGTDQVVVKATTGEAEKMAKRVRAQLAEAEPEDQDSQSGAAA